MVACKKKVGRKLECWKKRNVGNEKLNELNKKQYKI